MSWSASLPEPGKAADVDKLKPSPPDLDEGPKAQFEAAKKAAKALIKEAGDGPHNVTLSGHVSADADSRSDLTTITVGVAQAPPPDDTKR